MGVKNLMQGNSLGDELMRMTDKEGENLRMMIQKMIHDEMPKKEELKQKPGAKQRSNEAKRNALRAN